MPRVSHILDPVNITDSTHLHDIKKRKTYVVVIPTFSIIQRNQYDPFPLTNPSVYHSDI